MNINFSFTTVYIVSICIGKSVSIHISVNVCVRTSSSLRASHRISMCAHVTLITGLRRMHSSFCFGTVFGLRL